MNKYTKSKSSLFLMELVIVILFFSICAAVCMQLFVQTHLLGEKTRELNSSVAIAEGFAEVLRGTDGSIEAMLEYYPGAATDNETYLEVYYDKNFEISDYENAVYVSSVTFSEEMYHRNMDVSVMRVDDKSVIFTLNASKYTGFVADY